VEALKHLKARRKLPAWFNPPHTKDPETEESRAQDRAIKVEFVRRLWNAHRQLTAFPETRANMNPAVLLMLEFMDFSKIKDPDPLLPETPREERIAREAVAGPPERPVLSQPNIRVIGD
jgi:hypothetical protein